jgi:hypothetical protein
MRVAAAVVPVALLVCACEQKEQIASLHDVTVQQDFSDIQRECNSQALNWARGNLLTFAIVYRSCMDGKGSDPKNG